MPQNKWQTLQAFFEGFGRTAYDENTVPDDAALPYLTYEASGDQEVSSVFLGTEEV